MSHRRRDDSKLSFSDLDKRRRERKHRGGEADRDTPRPSAHAQKSYRAALERAFDSGKLAEFAATMQRTRNPLPGNASPDGPKADADVDQPAQAAPGAVQDPAMGAPKGPDATGQANPGGSPIGGPGDHSGDGPGDENEEQAVLEPAAPSPPPRTSARAEQRRLTRMITEAPSPRDMGKAADRYLARFGSLPYDYDVLEKVLSHPKPRVVLQALEALETWVAKQKPRRSRSLAVQLSILEETHEDSDIRELAARVRAAL